MLDVLNADAPPGFGEHYAAGMRVWRDPQEIAAIDQWLQVNDDANNKFLWSLAITNRALIDELIG